MSASGVPPPPVQPTAQPAMMPMPQQTAKPVIGGVLILLSSIIGLLMGVLFATGAGFFLVPIPGLDLLAGIFLICGIIFIITNLLGLIGAIFAIKRQHFGIAILGGILSMLFGGTFILGLIGLILVAISRNEFT